MRTSLLTPILLALLFVAAGQAFGQDPSTFYHITAKHSGRCLDVAGGPGATGDGVQVIQRDCNAGNSQKWKFTAVDDEYYKIVATHSGKALDVFGGIFTLVNGVAVKQWEYHGSANQMWKLVPIPSEAGYYKIVAKHSGLSLGIKGGPGATGNDAQAQQWGYWGGDNQKWKLTALTTTGACSADQIGSTLIGTAEMTASRVSNNPFIQPINLRIDLTECRANIRVTNFPPITTREYPTAIGPNTTTVSLIAGGSGMLSPTRSVSILLTLHFQHRLEMSPKTAYLGQPSDLTLTLRGQVAASGDVTLVGSGTFAGGFLNGSTGRLRVTGRLSPSP
jgi:Ricin-type beta-trefoil lectin domain.